MNINRVWAMPNKWTFTIKPIRLLIDRYMKHGKSIDPFAGQNSPAYETNDLNPENPAKFHMDALEFLKGFKDDNVFDIAFFDPPYSITQAAVCYHSFGQKKLLINVASMAYWKNIKDNLARLLKPNGIIICCGWNSQGLGKNRGFTLKEILLVPHGGSKNDTIVTVERKNDYSI